MSPHHIPLTIEEPTGVKRENWPVRWGVPFPKGALQSVDRVRLLNPDGAEHPCDISETACWPDASLRWVLLDFQLTLGPQETAVYYLDYSQNTERSDYSSPLVVTESPDRIHIATGPLVFRVNRKRFGLLEEVCLNGKPILRAQRLWLVDGTGVRYDLSHGQTRDVVLETRTSQRAVVRARGTYGASDGRACFDYLVRICAHKGLPWLEIETTFINTQDDPSTEIREIALETAVGLDGEKIGLCGSGRKLYESADPFYSYHENVLANYGVFAGSTIYRENGEKVEGVGIYEQQLARGWLDVSNAGRGVCVSLKDFVLLYPKEAAWKDDRITFSIWPARAEPLRLRQGMARTHAFMLHFHDGVGEDARVGELAAAYEDPLLPHNSDWYLESGAFGPVFPYRPDRYPLLERRLRDLTVAARDARSLGMLDYGDFVNVGSGSQGGFSCNNEPDRLHGFLLQHLRAGERIPWQLADAAAWHAMDVDTVHHTTRDPIELGGHRIHGHNHVQYNAEGYPNVSTVPSHMWTEGLLEYHYLTGHPRPREIALGIGDCFLKMVGAGWAQPPYHSNWHSARDSGWPLIGLAAVYEATGVDRYRQAMRRIFTAVRNAQHANGGWSMELFFHTGFCPFQIAVCLTGLARYHETCDDEDVRDVFLKGIAFLAGNAMRFPDGAWTYVTAPEYRGTYTGDSPTEPLAYAYHLTADKHPLRQTLKGWTRNLDLRASPRYLWALHTADLLEDG